jgi:cell filamentation protein
MNDPYIDEHSGILRNNFGITDQRQLDLREADAVGTRAILLRLNPVKGDFDTEHLQHIHRKLFQDVYEWAGEIRTVPLSKADQVGGRVTRFTPPETIRDELRAVFQSLRDDAYLSDLSRTAFVKKIAILFSDINRIHPFREGNGRAQRQFVRQLAEGVGHKIDFDVVSKERLVQASIASAHGDTAIMERLMDEITDVERIQPLKKLIAFFIEQGFDWNSRYLAMTSAGQSYEGVLAGRAGNDFFFHDGNKILVGKTRDLAADAVIGSRIRFTATG